MKNIGFSKLLDNSTEFQEIINSIKNGFLPAHINGVSEAVASHLVFCVGEKFSKGAFVITPDSSCARRIAEDLAMFYDDVLFFPEKELVFYNIDAKGNNITSERISALKKIISSDNSILYGFSASGGNKSSIPPRKLNCALPSTISSRL